MLIHLQIWRQAHQNRDGAMMAYTLPAVSPGMSFLEALDMLNEQLIQKHERPVEFDHDCREGICGQCGVMVNGRAHGPLANTTTCQLPVRHFSDGDTLYVEPFRAAAFPIKCDLKVARSAFDRIIQVGGFISASTGDAPEANSIPISHEVAEAAFDAASCIGCGACVTTCKNSSAALFTSAKIIHLALLPQGQLEARRRAIQIVRQTDHKGFGHCSNTTAYEVECPQEILAVDIARLNWEYNRTFVS